KLRKERRPGIAQRGVAFMEDGVVLQERRHPATMMGGERGAAIPAIAALGDLPPGAGGEGEIFSSGGLHLDPAELVAKGPVKRDESVILPAIDTRGAGASMIVRAGREGGHAGHRRITLPLPPQIE